MRSARNRRPVRTGRLRGSQEIARMPPVLTGTGGNAPMKKLVAIAVLGVIAGAASGCQTPEQSSMQASNVCMASGLHPGTHAYQRCYAANYTNLRANSQQAQNAAVAGAALGVAGGALAGAAIANSNGYYYGGYGPGWGYGWGRAAAGAAAGKASGAGETEGQRSRARPQAPSVRLESVRLLRRPAAMGRSDLEFLDPALFRFGTRRFQGLDKLGFPWILSGMSFFNGLRGIFREKNPGPCPSAGGDGTGEAERRNGRKRRSRGEDRSWGELSAASGFLQSIVVRHALAEIVAPDIRRRSLSAAALGRPRSFPSRPIGHAAK